MDFLNDGILKYSENNTTEESNTLKSLTDYTTAHVHAPQMLSGHIQGRFLSLMSKLIQPQTILEIGTYTGYSGICLAEGLSESGTLHTIDPDKSVLEIAAKYFKEAGISNKVKMHNNSALEVIAELPGPFDLVFIDADKRNYSNYYDAVIDKVRPGGLILADNVLWSGDVLQNQEDMDKQTKALFDYSAKINSDSRVSNILLPLRDGLMIAQKNG